MCITKSYGGLPLEGAAEEKALCDNKQDLKRQRAGM